MSCHCNISHKTYVNFPQLEQDIVQSQVDDLVIPHCNSRERNKIAVVTVAVATAVPPRKERAESSLTFFNAISYIHFTTRYRQQTTI